MPTTTGHGASHGANFGGGGLIRLYGLAPAPGGTIPVNGVFQLSAGVDGALVDLAAVKLVVGGEVAFSGGSFQGAFASGSTYQYNPAINGYDFSVVRAGGYLAPAVPVSLTAETRDGGTTLQTYQLLFQTAVVYPSVPLGVPLGHVSLSRFTGEAGGPLGGAAGLAFFTPALTPRGGSQIDVKDFGVAADAADAFVRDEGTNRRPWLWGPAPAVPPGSPPPFPPVYSSGYEPHLNRGFCFLKTTKRSVVGVITDTGTLVSTVILY